MVFARIGLDLHAISKQAIDFVVCAIERPVPAEGGSFVYLKQSPFNDLVTVSLTLQPVSEIFILDVAIAGTLPPIAETVVAEHALEERDDAPLGEEFLLSYRVHVTAFIGLLAPCQ